MHCPNQSYPACACGMPQVRASTIETYRARPAIPADAFVYFRGVDGHGTPLTKFATLSTHADPG